MRARQALLYALTARSTITQTTSACYMCTVGQNQCLHGIYSWQISMYTVLYGVYVQFWPTPYMAYR